MLSLYGKGSMGMSGNNIEKQKNKKRKNLLIAIAVITVLAAAGYVMTFHPELFEKKEEKKTVTSMYSDKIVSYNFYPSDYELDVTTVPEYMQLDRGVHYTDGNYTILVLDEEVGDYNKAVQFFVEYFKTIEKGDVDTYNTYFTDAYYETVEPYISFAPQMIYNINVQQLSETFGEDGTTTWTFNVSYMIYRNDGTFRNDIGSDASKKLYYQLISDRDGNVKINYITYYKKA